MSIPEILTAGLDHVSLSVASLPKSLAFFTECLHWRIVGERPDYPAAFVADGQTRLTLWQVQPAYEGLERRRDLGLPHLALRVRSLEDLHRLHAQVLAHAGVSIETSPEPSSGGPRVHFMIREPGGCRVEFVFDPRIGGR